MARRLLPALLAMATAFATLPARAQPYEELLETCKSPTSASDGIAACESLIAIHRDEPDQLAIAHYRRGNSYRQMREYDLALEDYNKALNLKPDYIAALNNRGLVYRAKGLVDRAIQDFDEAIRLWPKFALGLRNRGGAHNAKGRYDLAIRDFDRVVDLTPDDPWIYYWRGGVRRAQGKYDLAIKDMDEAIRLDPDFAKAYDRRGVVYEKLEQNDRAIQDCSPVPFNLFPSTGQSIWRRSTPPSGTTAPTPATSRTSSISPSRTTQRRSG